MARRRQRWTLAALLLQPASGFYARSRHNLARTVPRRSSADPAADDDTPVPVQKALAAMTAFSNRYVKVSGTKYCSEPSVPAVVIRGLAEHKAALGAPLLKPLVEVHQHGRVLLLILLPTLLLLLLDDANALPLVMLEF